MINPGKDLYETETAIQDLRERLQPLIDEKRDKEHRLSVLRNKIRGATGKRIPDKEYKSILRQQNNIKDELRLLEIAIVPIKNEIRRWNAVETELRANLADMPMRENAAPLRTSVVKLQEKYLGFAEDPTRINSMRLMASQFVKELDEVLKGK